MVFRLAIGIVATVLAVALAVGWQILVVSDFGSMARGFTPAACSVGAKGWRWAHSGQVTASISAVALSFIVHDPSGIMLVVSERSFDSSRRRYRSISVSEWCLLKTGCVR